VNNSHFPTSLLTTSTQNPCPPSSISKDSTSPTVFTTWTPTLTVSQPTTIVLTTSACPSPALSKLLGKLFALLGSTSLRAQIFGYFAPGP